MKLNQTINTRQNFFAEIFDDNENNSVIYVWPFCAIFLRSETISKRTLTLGYSGITFLDSVAFSKREMWNRGIVYTINNWDSIYPQLLAESLVNQHKVLLK